MASSCFLWCLFNLEHGDKYLLYHWGTSPVLVYWFLIYLSLSKLKLSALSCHWPTEGRPVPVGTGGFYGHYFGTFFLHPCEYLRHPCLCCLPCADSWFSWVAYTCILPMQTLFAFPPVCQASWGVASVLARSPRDVLSHQKLSSVCTAVVLEKGIESLTFFSSVFFHSLQILLSMWGSSRFVLRFYLHCIVIPTHLSPTVPERVTQLYLLIQPLSF